MAVGTQGSARSEDAPVRPAKTYTVTAQPSDVQRTCPAIVLPSREMRLTFRVSGWVLDLPVSAAKFVQEGDVIVRFSL